MNAEEIKQQQPGLLSTNAWLKEIALQLAKLNEPKKAGRPPKVKNV